MSNKIEDKSVRDILMCVIGEALMKVDASFMFGHDFSDIINKYGPILQHKPSTTEIVRKDIQAREKMIVYEGDPIYVLLIKSKFEPFEPLSYIDKIYCNEVDIWNCIEQKFYRFLNDCDQDVADIRINRYGVVIRLININGENDDYILYDIYKQTIS